VHPSRSQKPISRGISLYFGAEGDYDDENEQTFDSPQLAPQVQAEQAISDQDNHEDIEMAETVRLRLLITTGAL